MNTWTAGKDLMKHHYQMKKIKTDKDCTCSKSVWRIETNKRGDYHNFYLQSDTSIIPDIFENFRNKGIELYETETAHFLSAPGFTWQACLIKTGVELELVIDIDMLLMIEKGIRAGICHARRRHDKANKKYMKNCDKSVESSYLMYLDPNGWAMSQ